GIANSKSSAAVGKAPRETGQHLEPFPQLADAERNSGHSGSNARANSHQGLLRDALPGPDESGSWLVNDSSWRRSKGHRTHHVRAERRRRISDCDRQLPGNGRNYFCNCLRVVSDNRNCTRCSRVGSPHAGYAPGVHACRLTGKGFLQELISYGPCVNLRTLLVRSLVTFLEQRMIRPMRRIENQFKPDEATTFGTVRERVSLQEGH